MNAKITKSAVGSAIELGFSHDEAYQYNERGRDFFVKEIVFILEHYLLWTLDVVTKLFEA